MNTMVRRMAMLAIALAACDDDAPTGAAVQASVCPRGITLEGVDVAEYDGAIDWNAVHASGRAFGIARATDGTGHIDPTFATNWAGMRAAGMVRGAYQFFEPTQDPVAQADLLLHTVGPLEPGDLPPVIDVEVTRGQSIAQLAGEVAAWVDRVRSVIGRQPIVYTGSYFWNDNVQDTSEAMAGVPLWLAQYTTASCGNVPTAWSRWIIWQYTSSGTVPGIPAGNTDLDRFDGTLEELRALAGVVAPSDAGASADAGDGSMGDVAVNDDAREVSDAAGVGTRGDRDAHPGDAGEAGPTHRDMLSGGCGCSAVDRRPSGVAVAVGSALGLALARRRRRVVIRTHHARDASVELQTAGRV